MSFRFRWLNDEKLVMVYEAFDEWNWRDFHHVARAASFSMGSAAYPVHILLDLRGGSRTSMPAGLRAHLQTLGKKTVPVLSGQAFIMGFPQADEALLALDDERSFATAEGRAYLVNNELELETLLEKWGEHPPE